MRGDYQSPYSSHNALWLGRIVNKSQYKSLPHLHKPSLCWEKIWYYNLIPLIIVIIIIFLFLLFNIFSWKFIS